MHAITVEEAMTRKFPEWIGLLVTQDPDHDLRANLMPVGWFMCCSFEPPMLAVAVGAARHTHAALMRTRKFVLALAGEDQATLVRESGRCSGRDVDKFERFGIAHETGPHTECPLLCDAALNFECEVAGTLRSGDHTIFASRILAVYAPDEPVRTLVNFGKEHYAPAIPAT